VVEAVAIVIVRTANPTRIISRPVGNPVVELKVRDQSRSVDGPRTARRVRRRRELIRLLTIKLSPAHLLATLPIWQ
jgi:hypothetical protein